jgi:hypothetical protein
MASLMMVLTNETSLYYMYMQKSFFCFYFLHSFRIFLNTIDKQSDMEGKMNKKQRKQAFATNTSLEHVRLDPVTKVVNPSKEAIEQAKRDADDNQK